MEYSHELSVTAMVSLGTDFLTSSPTIPRYVAPSRICTAYIARLTVGMAGVTVLQPSCRMLQCDRNSQPGGCTATCGVAHLRVNPDHVAALRYAGQADRLEVRHSSSRVRGRYAHETTVEVKSVHLVGLEVEHGRDIAHADDVRCGHNRNELLARSQRAPRSRTTDARCGRRASLQ